jgi:hypothetical protein
MIIKVTERAQKTLVEILISLLAGKEEFMWQQVVRHP